MSDNICPRNSTILVTGGAGFIGSHVVDRLISCGNEVIVADNLSSGKKENINKRAAFYPADIKNEDGLKRIFENHRIDYVIHQAARINLNVMLEEPLKDAQSSVLGTLNLLKCCLDFGVKKIIYASSVAVYGRAKKLPVAETDELVPIYSYGIAKKCAEEYVRYYSGYYGLNYSILRYANVYGPRQPIYGEVGVIAIYTEHAIKGEPLVIYGDGNHLRDYIYIDDVVDVTLKVLNTGDRETFNIGCGLGISVTTVFDIFNHCFENKLNHAFKPERTGEIGSFFTNSEKANAFLNWKAAVDIKDGIRRTVDYYNYKG